MDVREIGQKLNVETVLEGSVQVAGNRIRITARLSNVDDGYQLWSENYERGMDDIFAVQDEIAQNIVNTLKVKLSDEKQERVIRHYTENREAYDLYMRGVYFMNKRGKENLEKAVNEMSNRALYLRTLSSLEDISFDQSNTIVFAVPMDVVKGEIIGMSALAEATKTLKDKKDQK